MQQKNNVASKAITLEIPVEQLPKYIAALDVYIASTQNANRAAFLYLKEFRELLMDVYVKT